RTSPGAVRGWLNRFPDALATSPAYLLLDGLLLWCAGQHEEALAPLRAAGEPARALLADALTSVGAFGEVADLEPNVPAVACFRAVALAAAGRVDGALALAAQLGADPQHRYLEDIAHVAFEPAGG